MPRDWTPAEEANRKLQLREAERDQRARNAASALASLAFEGLKPSPEVLAISDRYVDSGITVDEAMGETLAWWTRNGAIAATSPEQSSRRAADA